MSGLRISNIAFLGQVVASAAFSPPDSANLVFWGRPGSLAGADGDLISSFTDLSANLNHATATLTARPTLKTGIVNGQSVLRFSSNGMAWPNLFGAATAGEIFVVAKALVDPCALNKHPIFYIPKTTAIGETAHPYTDGRILESFGSDSSTSDSAGIGAEILKPVAADVWHIYSASVTTNELICRLNGAIFQGLNKVSPGFVASPFLGRNNNNTANWNGDLAEILVYKTKLSSANRELVYNYLATRYGLSYTAPATTYTPQSYAGLLGWWKADSLSLNDGDPVGSWTDLSGNARTLTGAGAARPTYKAAIYNGLPTVRYTSSHSLTYTAASLPGTFTMVFIGALTGSNSCLYGDATGASQMRVLRSGSDVMNYYTGSEETTTRVWNYGINTHKMFTCRRSASGHIGWTQNGVEIDYHGGANAGTFTSNRFGGTSGLPLVGDFSEAFLFNTALTNAEIAQLYYGYARSRWGLP